jgi:hypothetical protein
VSSSSSESNLNENEKVDCAVEEGEDKQLPRWLAFLGKKDNNYNETWLWQYWRPDGRLYKDENKLNKIFKLRQATDLRHKTREELKQMVSHS